MSGSASVAKTINPGAWLGLLGGGQLGRMFTMAAQSMGYKVMVLDPGADSPAGVVADRQLRAEYTDTAALAEMASHCAAATTEFENVPAETLQRLSEGCVVSPAAESVAIAQDRIREKLFLNESGFGVAPFAVIRTEADLAAVQIDDLLPGVLKVSRFGYDGKGQVRVASRSELGPAFRSLQSEPCVLEKFLPLEKEVSVVVCRGFDGDVTTFPVSENSHANGILDVSIVPARTTVEVSAEARDRAIELARKLDYRGVLCVEYFVLEDGRLLVNEIAPRPHNSGHYTIDACVSSQFEQQVRVMCSLPLGDTSLLCPAVMLNLLGDLWSEGTPAWESVLRHNTAKLHLYGKSTPRPGRKMGHVTVLAQQAEQALATALEIKSMLVTTRSESRLQAV
jgi:5-(carboxyamino)imidazole ribonucleotide synthase